MKQDIADNTEELVSKIVATCEDVKAIDIRTFDIRHQSSIADFYVICTGNSEPHLKAIGDRLDKQMKELNILANGIDGGASSQWIVMDFGSIIVHIMHPDAREYYNLESLWNIAKTPDKNPWECREKDILTTERHIQRQNRS